MRNLLLASASTVAGLAWWFNTERPVVFTLTDGKLTGEAACRGEEYLQHCIQGLSRDFRRPLVHVPVVYYFGAFRLVDGQDRESVEPHLQYLSGPSSPASAYSYTQEIIRREFAGQPRSRKFILHVGAGDYEARSLASTTEYLRLLMQRGAHCTYLEFPQEAHYSNRGSTFYEAARELSGDGLVRWDAHPREAAEHFLKHWKDSAAPNESTWELSPEEETVFPRV